MNYLRTSQLSVVYTRYRKTGRKLWSMSCNFWFHRLEAKASEKLGTQVGVHPNKQSRGLRHVAAVRVWIFCITYNLCPCRYRCHGSYVRKLMNSRLILNLYQPSGESSSLDFTWSRLYTLSMCSTPVKPSIQTSGAGWMGPGWSEWAQEWMIYPVTLSCLAHWGLLLLHWVPLSTGFSLRLTRKNFLGV